MHAPKLLLCQVTGTIVLLDRIQVHVIGAAVLQPCVS